MKSNKFCTVRGEERDIIVNDKATIYSKDLKGENIYMSIIISMHV